MKTNILKRAILLMSLMMLTNLAWAQRNQGAPPQPSRPQIKQIVNELSSELKLSDTQVSQLLELYQDHFDKMKSMLNGKRPDRETMQSFRRDFEAQVKTLLTKSQGKAYEKYLKSNAPQSHPQGRRP